MTNQPSQSFIPPDPGMLGFVRIAPPGDAPQAALFIRDQTATVLRFGRTPGIAGRFKGIDWQRTVLLVVIVLQVRTEGNPVLYDLVLNLRDQSVPFTELAVQQKLIIQFFGDEGTPLTACMLRNPFQEYMRRLMAQLEEYRPWSEQQFVDARQDLQRRHPTLESLWEALDHPPPAAGAEVKGSP